MKTTLIHEHGGALVAAADVLFFVVYGKTDTPLNPNLTFFKYDLAIVTEASEDEYLVARFGQALPAFRKYRTYAVARSDSALYMCTFRNSCLIKMDFDGNTIWEWESFDEDIRVNNVYSIAFEPPCFLWVASPVDNKVKKVSLESRKVVYDFGGDWDKDDPFNHPEGVSLFDNHLFISDMGHDRICKYDLASNNLETYLKPIDSPFEFIKIKNAEIVQSSEGLFRVET